MMKKPPPQKTEIRQAGSSTLLIGLVFHLLQSDLLIPRKWRSPTSPKKVTYGSKEVTLKNLVVFLLFCSWNFYEQELVSKKFKKTIVSKEKFIIKQLQQTLTVLEQDVWVLGGSR